MGSRIEDSLGAFCTHSRPVLPGSGEGPLGGRSFAVKDVFHIAGYRTGFGSPEWLETHQPATVTASAVQRLLDAGADMVGKTLTDELAYSLTGENVHYGTPVNPAAIPTCAQPAAAFTWRLRRTLPSTSMPGPSEVVYRWTYRSRTSRWKANPSLRPRSTAAGPA